MIVGIDEVGRGPWAGPLVVGAVVLGGAAIDGLTDSKKLTKKVRERLDIEIREKAEACGLGWVSATEIDEMGLSAALELACRRAVEEIHVSYHEIIIDGTVNFLKNTSKGQYVTTMKKADLLVPSVSAASVIAKVARDNYMAEQDEIYPGYGFKAHVGYGTAAHIAAIKQLGVTPLHRLSFAPLQMYRCKDKGAAHLSGTDLEKNGDEVKVATTVIGNAAENEVAHYLQRHGHEIIERNWKTKYCEIDIVSEKAGTLYFTEVKYRRQARQGGGFAAITRKKLAQMTFAAKFYAHTNKLKDVDLRLAAASVTGSEPAIEEFLLVE